VSLAIKLALRRLRQQHDTPPPVPFLVPLSAPVAGIQVLTGIAASIEVDLSRCCFAPLAFLLPPSSKMPPLFFTSLRAPWGGRERAFLQPVRRPVVPLHRP
jgi:hypothetical protein